MSHSEALTWRNRLSGPTSAIPIGALSNASRNRCSASRSLAPAPPVTKVRVYQATGWQSLPDQNGGRPDTRQEECSVCSTFRERRTAQCGLGLPGVGQEDLFMERREEHERSGPDRR